MLTKDAVVWKGYDGEEWKEFKMYLFNLFTFGIVAVWLTILQNLQATKRRLDPVRVSCRK